MTIYADAETRKTWRINYVILSIKSARDAADYWEQRRGGAPSDCVLALAHAIEQIDADEELLRQALDALEGLYLPGELERANTAITTLRERLEIGERV